MSDTLEIIELNDETGKLVDELEEQERYIKEANAEIERLQRQKEELQVNGLRQETLFKLEIERLTKQNKALNEMYELTKKEYIRLNNIIKELEKWLEEEQINSIDLDEWTIIQVRDKILELKGE